ncbi:MAG: C39 family peptidase [Bacteroidales bacterium]|jgi:hypothetical protein
MKNSLQQIFSQWDSRWANKMLGFNTNLPYNIYNFGCLLCDLAMAARYYGKDTDPDKLNEALKAKQGFSAGGGNYVWGSITKVYSDIKEKIVATPQRLTDDQINEIKTAIDNGFVVALHIDVNPKTVENDQHWVLAIGYNNSDENDFTIADPLGGRERSLKDYLGWFKPSARDTIERYLILEGKPAVKTIEVPADIWPNVIHGSTEWDKTVKKYLPERDPKATQFEDVQSVVGGYISRATTLENEKKQIEIDRDKALTEVENQKNKLANLMQQCQIDQEILKTDISIKYADIKALEKKVGSLEVVIESVRVDLREAQKDGGLKDLEITELKTKLAQCQNGETVENWLAKLIAFVKQKWSQN